MEISQVIDRQECEEDREKAACKPTSHGRGYHDEREQSERGQQSCAERHPPEHVPVARRIESRATMVEDERVGQLRSRLHRDGQEGD
jgi:hypothetical protein